MKKYFNVDLYHCKIILIICDWDEIEKYCSKVVAKNLKEGSEFTKGLTMYDYKANSTAIIYINSSCGLEVLAHECLHVTNFILKHRGIMADFENDEAQTYLFEYIYAKCLKYWELNNG